MKCDTNMMIKIGIGTIAALTVVYFSVPAAHGWVVASAPILLALICPLSMIFMMLGMRSRNNNEHDEKMEKPGTSTADRASASD